MGLTVAGGVVGSPGFWAKACGIGRGGGGASVSSLDLSGRDQRVSWPHPVATSNRSGWNPRWHQLEILYIGNGGDWGNKKNIPGVGCWLLGNPRCLNSGNGVLCPTFPQDGGTQQLR